MTGLLLGDTAVSKLYVGDTAATKLYLGDSQIWSASTPVSFVNANSVATTSVAIPTHAVGQLILIFAFTNSGASIPAPTPGGTVPAWTDIDTAAGIKVARFTATATNHTSGTWSFASHLMAVVLSNQAASPVGGHAVATATTTTVTAPSVTMSNTSGSSMLLHYHATNALSGAAWASAPAGYTRRAASVLSGGASTCLNTKDDTTSDGAVSQGTTSNATYRSATVEILAA